MHFLRLIVIAVAVFANPGFIVGQRASFGFVGGANLTRDFPISRQIFLDPRHPAGLTTFHSFSDTHSFIAGLSVEVELGKALSLEANALRRNLTLQRRFILPNGSLQDAGRQVVSTWQWPILLKYRLPSHGTVHLFVEAGPSFRTRHDPAPTEPSQIGATVGAGTLFRWGRFRLSPALRYTRWQYDGDFPRFATKRDQIELVTGFSYATSVPSWKVGGRKLRFGLIAGIPLTGGLDRRPWGYGELQGYIGGLATELEFNRHLSIELNGLYRPFRGFEFTVLTWQFPVLAKYRLRPDSRLEPVLQAGPSFRLSGNLSGYDPSRFGFTVGGGIGTYYKALQIGQVVRYTRWTRDSVMLGPLPGPRTAAHQVELLFSFTF
jgi:hypothetical protein